jgi:patatin-like phospholipase/acyl hydrolase
MLLPRNMFSLLMVDPEPAEILLDMTSEAEGRCRNAGTNVPGARELCLLSLDGGGIRGISSLLVLKKLMELIDPDDPPRPCDYFDMIGGTSTGGLIALMLGRLRLTVDACIQAYTAMSPKIFSKSHHRINLKNGETQGRFNHEALESGVKEMLRKYRFDPEAFLKDSEGQESCKV